MLFLQDAVPAQDAVDLTQSSTDFAWPGIVFIFVSFIVVAKLVAKHLVQRHELEIKFEESGKASHLKHSRGSNAWIGIAVAIVVALMFALAVLFAGVGIGGWKAIEELPSLSTPATVFIFVAFLVVVNLISQHLTMKHEHAMKTGKFERVEQETPSTSENTGKLWVLGVVGIALMFPLLWMLLRPSHIEAPVNVVSAPPQTIGVTPADATAPNQLPNLKSWTEALPFDADQYPGIEACAAPLARRIAKEIEADRAADLKAKMMGAEVEAAPEIFTTVFISNFNMNGMWWPGAGFGKFREAVEKALKSEMPSVSFHSRTGAKKYEISFGFSELQVFTKAYAGEAAFRSGKIVCRWKDLPSKTHSVAFVEKPWLTHFKEFKLQAPQSRCYIGASTRVEPLLSQAHEHAVQDLTERLELKPEQVESNIVDSFTQTIERPYGKVYREAILVQNPPELVHHSLPSSTKLQFGPNGYRLSRTNTASTASPSFEFSLAMIVCLTVVAGFVSNLATQGYYRSEISQAMWPVIAVAVVFLVLTIVFQFA